MHCAGCGQVLTSEAVCGCCGRPAEGTGSIRGNEAAQLYVFERTIRRLLHYWFLFACLNFALGVTNMVLIRFGMSNYAGPWEPWPHPILLDWMYMGAIAWGLLIARVALAATAAMGLRDRAPWARIAVGLAAVLAFTDFPIGLMLGAYTLVKILGPRNKRMFEKFAFRTS